MRSPEKQEQESSPALSLKDEFLQEIYKRCSPLKRTTFQNNYLNMDTLSHENIETGTRSKATAEFIVSPEPEPS